MPTMPSPLSLLHHLHAKFQREKNQQSEITGPAKVSQILCPSGCKAFQRQSQRTEELTPSALQRLWGQVKGHERLSPLELRHPLLALFWFFLCS